MANKSNHYRKAVDKIHHTEVKDYESEKLPEAIRENYSDFSLTIGNGVICIECVQSVSKISFKEVPVEVEHDSAMECFQAGGGCIQKEVVLIDQKQLLVPDDESIPVLEIEDDRKEYGIDEFLSDLFGGNVSLATTPARYVGFGF
jgi:hypothetical protein